MIFHVVRHCPADIHLPIQTGRSIRNRSVAFGAQQTLLGHRYDPEEAAPVGQAHCAHRSPDCDGREGCGHETRQYVSRHLDATSVLLFAESAPS